MENQQKVKRPAAWSAHEDRLIVRDYLAMHARVSAGLVVNKAATRRALLPQLNGRSEASVEFKRCNVSACMVDLGRAWLPGYRPASNYQRSLLETVRNELANVASVASVAPAVVAQAAA